MKKENKTIALIFLGGIMYFFLVVLTSCSKDGQDCSKPTFSLTAWQNESGMIQISYNSEIVGYEILTGCETIPNYEPETYNILDHNEKKNWAEWSITRECKPEYIKVRSLDGRIEKIVRL